MRQRMSRNVSSRALGYDNGAHALTVTKAPGLPETRYKPVVIAKGEGIGSKALEGINKQGGRFIRGLETYLGSLESRKSAWTDKTPEQLAQTLEKEREKWDGVVDKVEEKFGQLIMDVQGDVHKWYAGIRTRENEVVRFFRFLDVFFFGSLTRICRSTRLRRRLGFSLSGRRQISLWTTLG